MPGWRQCGDTCCRKIMTWGAASWAHRKDRSLRSALVRRNVAVYEANDLYPTLYHYRDDVWEANDRIYEWWMQIAELTEWGNRYMNDECRLQNEQNEKNRSANDEYWLQSAGLQPHQHCRLLTVLIEVTIIAVNSSHSLTIPDIAPSLVMLLSRSSSSQ